MADFYDFRIKIRRSIDNPDPIIWTQMIEELSNPNDKLSLADSKKFYAFYMKEAWNYIEVQASSQEYAAPKVQRYLDVICLAIRAGVDPNAYELQSPFNNPY
jgi:hypothetical protein